MKGRLLAAVVASLLVSGSVPYASMGASQSLLLRMTVYPDGSVGVFLGANASGWAPPGTLPSADVKVGVTTSGGITTEETNGSLYIPPSLRNQLPFNLSLTASASGTYSGGVSKGSVVVQAVPGFSTPFTSVLLNYNSTRSSITVTGNATVEYGTYKFGGTTVQINSTSVAGYLDTVQKGGINATHLNSLLEMLPVKNLTVTSLSLEANYRSSSATVFGVFRLEGNITALPLDFVYLELGCPSSPSCSQFSSLSSENTLNSNLIDSSYQVSYSAGLLGFKSTAHAKQNMNADELLKLLAKTEKANGAPPSVYEFLNSTKIDVSNFNVAFSLTQQAEGSYALTSRVSGVTVTPAVVFQGNEFNEFALFGLFGQQTFPGNLTIVGGSTATSHVNIKIPAGTPAPLTSSNNSATWKSVQVGRLAGVEFFVVAGGAGAPGSGSSGFASSTVLYIAAGVASAAVVAIAAVLLLRGRHPASPAAP